MGNWFSTHDKMQHVIEQQAQAIIELKQQISVLQQNTHPATAPKLPSVVRKRLLEWIDKQLADPENNITLMPDIIERQLKAQIFGMFLNMIDYILETTSIDFMGHKIKFDLVADQTPVSEFQ